MFLVWRSADIFISLDLPFYLYFGFRDWTQGETNTFSWWTISLTQCSFCLVETVSVSSLVWPCSHCSYFDLPSARIRGMRHHVQFQSYFYLIETWSHYVALAGLEPQTHRTHPVCLPNLGIKDLQLPLLIISVTAKVSNFLLFFSHWRTF